MPRIKTNSKYRQDLTGQRFGKLVAIERLIQGKGIAVKYKCQCDCGIISFPTGNSLKSGVTKSCGCNSRGAATKGTKKTPQQKASHLRAGVRKCSRCKNKFYKPSGTLVKICDLCKTRCVRCDAALTETNFCTSSKKVNKYICNACLAEGVRNTKGNNGFNQKEYDLLRNYFITNNEYEALLKYQNGLCFICKKPPAKIRLSVDHQHEKGERQKDVRLIRARVRGLLCWSCNKSLAYLKDSPENANRAAEYLKDWPAQKVLKKLVLDQPEE